jgi:hypothetical protein
MDLLSRDGHFCSGWPCVTACELKALKRPHQGSDRVKLVQVQN